MLNYVEDLDSVFHALADPGRRRMLERLGQGPASVSELGKSLPMSLAAVVQHVQILEASGLVRTQKLGRTRMCSLNSAPLRSAEHWISERRAFVERSLDRLGQYLAETTETAGTPTNAERPGLHPLEEETS
jgi:DNA-binding transcriptional ArsR family regulator